MRWARVVVVLGVLLVLGAFALGTEVRPTVSLSGSSYDCRAVVRSHWLVAGSPDDGAPRPVRAGAACAPPESRLRWAVGGALTAGAVLVALGWGALRERELGSGAGPSGAEAWVPPGNGSRGVGVGATRRGHDGSGDRSSRDARDPRGDEWRPRPEQAPG